MSSVLTTRPAPGEVNAAPWASAKLQDHHFKRSAIVYVRQSSAHQVQENRESTARQYALAERAVQLGWAAIQVEVIDEDQGRSGKTAEALPCSQSPQCVAAPALCPFPHYKQALSFESPYRRDDLCPR